MIFRSRKTNLKGYDDLYMHDLIRNSCSDRCSKMEDMMDLPPENWSDECGGYLFRIPIADPSDY